MPLMEGRTGGWKEGGIDIRYELIDLTREVEGRLQAHQPTTGTLSGDSSTMEAARTTSASLLPPLPLLTTSSPHPQNLPKSRHRPHKTPRSPLPNVLFIQFSNPAPTFPRYPVLSSLPSPPPPGVPCLSLPPVINAGPSHHHLSTSVPPQKHTYICRVLPQVSPLPGQKEVVWE